jgi:hypothetical protein
MEHKINRAKMQISTNISLISTRFRKAMLIFIFSLIVCLDFGFFQTVR